MAKTKASTESKWSRDARARLKYALNQQNVTYARLAAKLGKIGVPETERSIANKLYRGTFTFIFFLQCMSALDVTIDLRGKRDSR